MIGVFVDSCILLDLFTDDPCWGDWSQEILEQYSQTNSLYINAMVYTEVSIGFNEIEEVEDALSALSIKVVETPKEALFLAGKVFLKYRKNKGTKTSPLQDFFIASHVAVSGFDLITRDLGKYRTYFPQIKLIHPEH